MSNQIQQSVIEMSFTDLVAVALKRKWTAEKLAGMLKARILRDQRYLTYRANNGAHTAYDDVTATDLPMLALSAAFLTPASK
jgi:thiazole synthase ThiGH ThiG subunit